MSIYMEAGFKKTELIEANPKVYKTDFEIIEYITKECLKSEPEKFNKSQIVAAKEKALYLIAGKMNALHRCDANLNERTLAFIDLDDVINPAEFISNAQQKLTGLRYVIYPTISSGIEHSLLPSHKNSTGIYYGFRIVVDLSRAVNKNEYRMVVKSIANKLQVKMDTASLTWSQHMGAPVHTLFNDMEHYTVIQKNGEAFDVESALKPSTLADVIQMPKQKSHHPISQPKALSAIATWAEKHAVELADESFFVRTIRFLVEEENEGRLSKPTVDAAGKLLALHNPDWEIDNQSKIDSQRHESLQQNKLSFAQFFSAVDGPDWIMTTTKGQPLYNSTANTVAWLNWDIEQGKTGLVSIKYNSFSNQYEIHDSKGLRALSDADVRSLQFDMQHVSSFNVTKDSLFDGVYVFGDRHRYNPIVDAIMATKWDGRRRISNVFAKYLGAEDNDYTRKINRVWLLQLVNRLVNPGSKADIVPILIGKQGLGKSTLARRLAYSDDYFSDSLRDMMGNKDELSKLAGKSIVELGELNSMRKSSIEDTKSFISKQSDDFRPAYARTVQTFKRTASFIGTSNYSDVLVDSTGERRFWPIQCGVNKAAKSVFDLTSKDAEVLQMYAEAFAALKAGEKPYLEHNEIVALMPSQREFKKYDLVVDALESELAVLANQGKKCISKHELAKETLRFVHIKEDQNGDNPERSKVNYASVLSRVGKLMGARNDWNYKQTRVEDGKRKYMYVLEEN